MLAGMGLVTTLVLLPPLHATKPKLRKSKTGLAITTESNLLIHPLIFLS
jgi:hypothetical protein